MADPVVQRLHDWLHAHETELLDDTRAMLRVPSLEAEAREGAPFGEANRQALDLALQLSEKVGMKTTNLEGYIGYAEFGSGDRLVLSLGHLDVVPTGQGWKHDPFGAEIDGEYIYARGSCDDKGPTMASFYAMRAIKECVPDLPVRMRQAFGCNEESGFKCVYRYVETEEAPTFGIAPDSGWPLINREKGIANLEVSAKIPDAEFKLLEICGGERPNIVIDRCTAKVSVGPSVRGLLETEVADSWDRNLSFSWQGDELSIGAIGKASHGAQPYRGDSAAARILRFLREAAPADVEPFYGDLFDLTHPGGAGLGISGSDEPSRDLTCNLGIISLDEGAVEMLFNVRYPVTWTGARLEEMCRAHLSRLSGDFQLKIVRDSAPLFFPLDHPLVRTICDVYEEETGERREPGSMGGGTYARAVPNTVSIGTGWWGDGTAHEADERLKVEHLYKMSRIYAHILYRLATI